MAAESFQHYFPYLLVDRIVLYQEEAMAGIRSWPACRPGRFAERFNGNAAEWGKAVEEF
jgi:hypothetical protein